MNQKSIVAPLMLLMVFSLLLVSSPPPTTAQFVLAGWDYPDEYGQGIEEVSLYQNVSGSWESLTPFGHLSNGVDVFDIWLNATGIRIVVKCWLNNTIVGADDFADGKNKLRHSVTFSFVGGLGGPIFTQENFTYDSGTDSQDPMYYYIYSVNIPFSPTGGVYTAFVTYEVYYGVIV